MKLEEIEKHLLLNKYLLRLLGFGKFADLRSMMANRAEGPDSNGRSHFVNEIIRHPEQRVGVDELLKHDATIKEYAKRIGEGREDITLKYFQYLAVLFAELFLDRLYGDRENFLRDINQFVDEYNSEKGVNIGRFSEADLKKLAFWMATGSGKTLIMHANYWQILKRDDGWDNIILVTPSKLLSKQHYKDMRLSGIPCRLYDGNTDHLKTDRGEVLIIEIQKLVEKKKGEGVTVETSYFDGRNLVFVDEGHEGQKSDVRVWKRQREELGKNGFIFEYSATFGQVIGATRELLGEYAKAILFTYSYKYFYEDGYGKDPCVYNLKEGLYTKSYGDFLLTAGLLSFYEQLTNFKNKKSLREYNIEKPLWVFVGSRVTGKGLESDIVKILRFLDRILRNENYLEKCIRKVLSEKSGLVDKEGEELFKDRFGFLRRHPPSADEIYRVIFKGRGVLEFHEIKNAEGEIGLKTSLGGGYFGVVNVGDVSSLKKLVKESNIETSEDRFNVSLFSSIDDPDSHIKLLIGSKKFMEGWDCWRVSNMCLINMGRGEGPQIIQLFGRGVRLKGKGKGKSLKREENPEYSLKTLQTLYIFGLNADYVNTFLEAIRREGIEHERRERIPYKIKYNQPEKWEGKIRVVEMEEGFDFTGQPVRLEADADLLSSFKVDIRPEITMAHGLETERAVAVSDEPVRMEGRYLCTVDWDRVYTDAVGYKTSKGYYNLLVDKETLKRIIETGEYRLFALPDQIRISKFGERREIQGIVETLLRRYIDGFYRREEKKAAMNHLRVRHLKREHPDLNFSGENGLVPYLEVPERLANEIRMLINESEKLYKEDIEKIPTIVFDKHLYAPLVAYAKNKEYIKAFPVKLNEGETKFVWGLKKFAEDNQHLFKNRELFLLRNLSKKGVGFFMRSGFYPDFIMWIKENGRQKIVFIDPKGLWNVSGFDDDKIQFCTKYVKEIEKQVNKGNKTGLELYAFILSVSKHALVKRRFGDASEEEFAEYNVMFPKEDDHGHIWKILEKIGVTQ